MYRTYTCRKDYPPYFTKGKTYLIQDIGHEILVYKTDDGKEEETFPSPNIEYFVYGEIKEGLGHQYKKDEKAFHACKQSLENAIRDLEDVNNADANMLKFEMQKLANKCWHLAYSAFEAQKQDN